MNVEDVKRITQQSKQEKWPYPKTFQALIEAGVTSYRTEVSDHRTTYSGNGVDYEEEILPSSTRLEVSTIFHKDAVKRALEHHQKFSTPYENFLKDIASAGVNYYLVDMVNRAITYTSGKVDEAYIQSIPK